MLTPARAQVIIAFHLVLYWFDKLPLTYISFGILCHLVYLQNIGPTWPLISLSSPAFIASCLLVLADHFLWFFYFADQTKAAKKTRGTYRRGDPGPSFGDISTFFAICVWCVPLFLFLSLSANDNVLPSNGARSPCYAFSMYSATYRPSAAGNPPSSPSTLNLNAFSSGSTPSPYLHERRSILKRILDPIVSLLPGRRGRRQMDEGIIAPSSRTHSPASSRPSSPSWATSSFSPRAPSFIEGSGTISGRVNLMNPPPPRKARGDHASDDSRNESEVVPTAEGTGEGLGIRARRAPPVE